MQYSLKKRQKINNICNELNIVLPEQEEIIPDNLKEYNFNRSDDGGIVIVHNNAQIHPSAHIYVENSGMVLIEDGCKIGANSKIYSKKGTIVYVNKETFIHDFALIVSDFESFIYFEYNNQIERMAEIGAWGGVIKIGSHTSIGSMPNLRAHNTVAKIGNDCMFAQNVTMVAGDGHYIYDIETLENITSYDFINLDNHVWCGVGATLLSGAKVGTNSIVGAASLVNKMFEENSIIAGVPAKTIRKGIGWKR